MPWDDIGRVSTQRSEGKLSTLRHSERAKLMTIPTHKPTINIHALMRRCYLQEQHDEDKKKLCTERFCPAKCFADDIG